MSCNNFSVESPINKLFYVFRINKLFYVFRPRIIDLIHTHGLTSFDGAFDHNTEEASLRGQSEVIK